MLLRKLMGAFACALILSSATFAIAGVPDLSMSPATFPGDQCVLMNVPDGTGANFTQAVDVATLAVVDATIGLTVNDGLGFAIAALPAVDMWLETSTGGMVYCSSGTIADQNTAANGFTFWQAALLAGGYATGSVGLDFTGIELTRIKVNGATHPDPIPILMNSPDITGDLIVNLQDVPAFAENFHDPVEEYHFRSDLIFDKIVNVADIPGLAANMDKACP